MEDITKYFKGTAPLEEREKKLFDLIKKLNDESNLLYNEILDISDNGINACDDNKLYELYDKLTYLLDLFNETEESYNYLFEIEASSYSYASARFTFKIFLSTLMTIIALSANAFLGLISFIVLNKKATNDFCREIDIIGDKLNEMDDKNRLDLIERTLNDCNKKIGSNKVLSKKVKKI